ncbi:hypothetical protein GF373_06750, partial [bacterium]|nr:hypothetical protein [bacterium]
MKLCIYAIFFSLITATLPSAEKPIEKRLQDRAFPSIFMAWARADNRPHLTKLQNIAQHDLAFVSTGALQLKWDHIHDGLATTFTQDSIIQANTIRKKLLSINPNLILLVEIRYRDAWDGFIPKDHPWWMRNEKGERVKGWEEGRFYKLNYTLSTYRNHVAQRAKAAVETGVVDGIMLDWWWDDNDRLALIKQIRKGMGKKALILANANERKIPLTAPYINGLFMECTQT